MKPYSYSIIEKVELYLLQILLKLYKKLNPTDCSTFCEQCISELLQKEFPPEKIEKISFMKKILQRYVLPESPFKNL